ncbi:MAG: hypothetical protein JWQ70_787 [Aeromicrobium sp.]|jgi:hypothetical protein|nr:hypothetical protein [Aeromicrobium sp.]
MVDMPSNRRTPLHRRATRRLWLPLLLAVLIALGGAADAYWRSSGHGGGGGATDSPLAVVLTPGVPTAHLRPGGTTDAVLTMTNPNTVPITLGSLALDTTQGSGGFAVDAGHSTCTVVSLRFTTQTAGWTVPARVGTTDGSLDLVLADAVSMLIDAPDSCQGVHISIYLRAGA